MTPSTAAPTITETPLPSTWVDVAYASITLGTMTLWSLRSSWLLYFYLPPANQGQPLVAPALYGLALFIPSVVDVIVGPLVGYWSDHARFKWGRRLPFIFMGGLPLLALFVLLWMPPLPHAALANAVYLTVIMSAYNIAANFCQIPYSTLLPELAQSERHRLRLSAWASGFQLLSFIIGGLAGLALDQLGYVGTAALYAGVVFPLFYLPFLILREQPGRQIAASARLQFWKSFSVTLRNRLFRRFSLTWALYWMTTTIISAIIPYIATELCQLSKSDTLYFYLAGVVASLVCFPGVSALARRVGKWRVLAGSLLASLLVLPGVFLISPAWPLPLLYQGILWVALEAVAMSGLMVMARVFMAEITDHDAAQTGQRREGSYYSVQNLLGQMVNALALVILPLVLQLGNTRANPLGIQLAGALGGLLLGFAFLFFLRYPRSLSAGQVGGR